MATIKIQPNKIIPLFTKKNRVEVPEDLIKNPYLLAESLLKMKAHGRSNTYKERVFDKETGMLERPYEMLHSMMSSNDYLEGKPIARVLYQNYDQNKTGDRHSGVNVIGFIPSYAVFSGEKKVEEETTIMFTAHHDIVNPSADNIQDNLASCCHVISTFSRTIAAIVEGLRLPHNLLFVIFDEEESGMGGSRNMARTVQTHSNFGKVEAMINLELTARGTHFWIDQSYNVSSMIFKEGIKLFSGSRYANIDCPPNDAMPFRAAGLDAACVGMLNRKEMEKVLSKKVPRPLIWNICHSNEDTFAKANEEDMNYFTSILTSIAAHNWSEVIEKAKANRKAYGTHPYKGKKPSTTYGSYAGSTGTTYGSTTGYANGYHNGYNNYNSHSSGGGSTHTVSNSSSFRNRTKDEWDQAEREFAYWYEGNKPRTNKKSSKKGKETGEVLYVLNKQIVRESQVSMSFFSDFIVPFDEIVTYTPVQVYLAVKEGKGISAMDYEVLQYNLPDLAEAYEKAIEQQIALNHNISFIDPNASASYYNWADLVKLCTTYEDFYYAGLAGMTPSSCLSCSISSKAYACFIYGHTVRAINILSNYSFETFSSENYLSLEDVLSYLNHNNIIGTSSLIECAEKPGVAYFDDYFEDIIWQVISDYIILHYSDDSLAEVEVVNLAEPPASGQFLPITSSERYFLEFYDSLHESVTLLAPEKETSEDAELLKRCIKLFNDGKSHTPPGQTFFADMRNDPILVVSWVIGKLLNYGAFGPTPRQEFLKLNSNHDMDGVINWMATGLSSLYATSFSNYVKNWTNKNPQEADRPVELVKTAIELIKVVYQKWESEPTPSVSSVTTTYPSTATSTSLPTVISGTSYANGSVGSSDLFNLKTLNSRVMATIDSKIDTSTVSVSLVEHAFQALTKACLAVFQRN